MASGLIEFPNQEEMTDRLVTLIGAQLSATLSQKPRALFAVSGGSSPQLLYERLSVLSVDWSRVDILLVDERWVNPGQEGSNETFIKETLLQNLASEASLIGLKTSDACPRDGVPGIAKILNKLSDSIDVAVMGMGPDAHTASWFPRADNLNIAIDPHEKAKVVAIKARRSEVTGSFLDRITLTLSFVAKTAVPILMINGDAKFNAYNKANTEDTDTEDFPVKALIEHCPNLWPCWAP